MDTFYTHILCHSDKVARTLLPICIEPFSQMRSGCILILQRPTRVEAWELQFVQQFGSWYSYIIHEPASYQVVMVHVDHPQGGT